MSNTARNFYFPSEDALTDAELRAERIADREAEILADLELVCEAVCESPCLVYRGERSFGTHNFPADYSGTALLTALLAQDFTEVGRILHRNMVQAVHERAVDEVVGGP